MKKVNVAMAVHNVENFIIMTLKAIQNQTYKDFDCIIVDDHSTDNTVQIIYEMFCKNDSRFKLYVNCTDKDNPYVDVHNVSYSLCDSEYIIRLDGDDVPKPNLIEKYVEFMDNHKEYDACCSTVIPMWSNTVTGQLERPEEAAEVSPAMKRGWFDVFPDDKETDKFNSNPIEYHVFHPMCWCNQCSCIRKDFLTKHNLKFKYCSYGDYLFWVEFLAEGGKAYKMKDKLLIYRICLSSISHNGTWKKVSPRFELDLAKAKCKIVRSRNNPADRPQIIVFENTIRYFENLIKKEESQK